VPDREIILPATIHVGLPQKARIVLVKNGKSVSHVQSDCADFPVTEKGLYRIEVYMDKCAWIYSNPFVVGRYPLW
jgi:hypothetical protein